MNHKKRKSKKQRQRRRKQLLLSLLILMWVLVAFGLILMIRVVSEDGSIDSIVFQKTSTGSIATKPAKTSPGEDFEDGGENGTSRSDGEKSDELASSRTDGEGEVEPSGQEASESETSEPDDGVSFYAQTVDPTASNIRAKKGSDFSEARGRIFIGDSRFVFVQRQVQLTDQDIFISKGAMYFEWFRDEAVDKLRIVLDGAPNYTVIINMGVNDCANNCAGYRDYSASDYALLINELIEEYPDTRFYYASVGYTDGNYTGSRRQYSMYEMQPYIGDFNMTIRAECNATYLPLCEYLDEDGYSTFDGVHWNRETCQKVYDYIVENAVY